MTAKPKNWLYWRPTVSAPTEADLGSIPGFRLDLFLDGVIPVI